MATGTGNFPNRPYRLRVETWYNWQSGSAVSVHVQIWIDGTYGSYSGAGSSWELHIDSRGKVNGWAGGFDFRGQSNILIHEGDYAATTNINGDVGVHAYANFDVLGYTEAHVAIDGYPLTTPPAPTMLTPDTVTINSMRARFNSNGDGGSGITGWQLQYATDAAFTNNLVTVSSSGTTTISGLNPGTTYYLRARGSNAVGWGAWSNVVSQSTIPATAPTLAFLSNIAGNTSTVTVIPPGDVTGVTEYNFEFRLGSAGAVTPKTSTGNTFVQTGLTPGAVYQYRANVEIDTYTSPWSAWIPFTQSNPNTNAGDFFDGDTTDTTDTDFQWVSTAKNSPTIAYYQAPKGWLTFAQGVALGASGGAGAVARVSGSFFTNAFGARVSFWADTTSAGFIFGISAAGAADASQFQPYIASIHVRLPFRSQRLQPGIMWLDNSDTPISYTWGAQYVVAAEPGNFYGRYTVSGTAPANTVKAAPVMRDVSGTGWSTWMGGDVILMDAAMVAYGTTDEPYFDGNTPKSDTYVYAWTGLNGNSTSTRYPNNGDDVDPLLDPDCPPLPTPPLPPTIASDCIDDVGIWRRYTYGVSETDIRLWGSTLPTMIMTTGANAERQVRIRFYENPDGLAPDVLDKSTHAAELILTYIPPATEVTLDSVTQRVRVSVAGGDSIVGNQLLYGTGGRPATWPELRCGIGYVITLDVPTDAPAGNLTTRVLLTQRV